MKIKKNTALVLLFALFGIGITWAQQRDYRRDSLQFKIYTRLYVNPMSELDSIVVKKVFCDFCSEKQKQALREEAYRRSIIESRSYENRKPGKHKLAIYIRLSKVDFKALNEEDE